MKREFLKSIEGLTDEAIDKIMAEHGKALKVEMDKASAAASVNAALTTERDTYKAKVSELEKLKDDSGELKKKLDALNEQIAADKKAAEDAAKNARMEKNIKEAFGEKKFVNVYTERSLIEQVKAELGKAENVGKGISDIVTALTKDVEGIFANPNPADMSGFGKTKTSEIDDAKARAIVGLPVVKKET